MRPLHVALLRNTATRCASSLLPTSTAPRRRCWCGSDFRAGGSERSAPSRSGSAASSPGSLIFSVPVTRSSPWTPPPHTSPPQIARVWQAMYPNAATCAQAALRDWTAETIFYRIALGLVGLVARARARRGASPLHSCPSRPSLAPRRVQCHRDDCVRRRRDLACRAGIDAMLVRSGAPAPASGSAPRPSHSRPPPFTDDGSFTTSVDRRRRRQTPESSRLCCPRTCTASVDLTTFVQRRRSISA